MRHLFKACYRLVRIYGTLDLYDFNFKNQIFIIRTGFITPKRVTSGEGPSPLLTAGATQLQRNVATVASRWGHCGDLTGPGIESQTFRTDCVRLATKLMILT